MGTHYDCAHGVQCSAYTFLLNIDNFNSKYGVYYNGTFVILHKQGGI